MTTIEDLDLLEIKERARCRSYHLTYHAHYDLDEKLMFLETISKTKIKEYSIVNEIGATGHKHCHCYIKWNEAINVTPENISKIFDHGDDHPHIRSVNSEIYRQRVLKYHHKEKDSIVKTNVDDISKTFIQEFRIKTIKEAKSWASLLENPDICDWLRGSMQYAKELFNLSRNRTHHVGKIQDFILPYHNFIMEQIITQPVSYRFIYWFYDPKGGMCKTRFSKHLSNVSNAFISKTTTLNDFAHGFRNRTDSPIVILDLPKRTSKEPKDLYKILECLKDGTMNCDKYDSTTLTYNVPHVICFSNEKPKTHYLSIDRLQVYFIDQEGSCHHQKNTVDDDSEKDDEGYSLKLDKQPTKQVSFF